MSIVYLFTCLLSQGIKIIKNVCPYSYGAKRSLYIAVGREYIYISSLSMCICARSESVCNKNTSVKCDTCIKVHTIMLVTDVSHSEQLVLQPEVWLHSWSNKVRTLNVLRMCWISKEDIQQYKRSSKLKRDPVDQLELWVPLLKGYGNHCLSSL